MRDDAPPTRSRWLMRWFGRYVRRYAGRHFAAVRVSGESRLASLSQNEPIIVVLNHPSWWDPLIGILLTQIFRDRDHYAPIDADSLRRFRFFGRLGFFGVEQGTVHGAVTFMRTGESILRRPASMLWITAQGRFADPRARPLNLRSGISHLGHRLGRGFVLPLALEYPFWEERRPEALARFGAPLDLSSFREASVDHLATTIEESLTNTMEELAGLAQRRDPAAFRILLAHRGGITPIYDWWLKLRGAPR